MPKDLQLAWRIRGWGGGAHELWNTGICCVLIEIHLHLGHKIQYWLEASVICMGTSKIHRVLLRKPAFAKPITFRQQPEFSEIIDQRESGGAVFVAS